MKSFFEKNKQLVAFAIVVIASFYLFTQASDDRDAIIKATQAVVIDSCQNDRANATITLKLLDRQIDFVVKSEEQAPPTIAQRVAELKYQKSQVAIPNCQERLKKFQKVND